MTLPGTVKFIFQPAEEGPPAGEKGGASLMVEEGVLRQSQSRCHLWLTHQLSHSGGQIRYKAKGIMAAAQRFKIDVKGKQAHGSAPWMSVDPIVISAQIINGLQSIISRNAEFTKEGAVISVGLNSLRDSLQHYSRNCRDGRYRSHIG